MSKKCRWCKKFPAIPDDTLCYRCWGCHSVGLGKEECLEDDIEDLWKSGKLKGKIVRVAKTGRTAMVQHVMKGPEGAVCLDRPIDGFRYWNIDELELMP